MEYFGVQIGKYLSKFRKNFLFQVYEAYVTELWTPWRQKQYPSPKRKQLLTSRKCHVLVI